MKKIILAFLFLFCVQNFCIANVKIDVLKIYDGDSILARIDDNVFRIRLIGIDCFEGTESSRAKWQAREKELSLEEIVKGGNIAKDILSAKLKNKEVYFEFAGIDKYSRALGNLYVEKSNINNEMLKTPYCYVYMPKGN